MHLHHTIHVSLLKPHHARKNVEGEVQMEVDEEDEPLYMVDQITNSRRFTSGVKYLVRWDGYGEEHDTWQPMDTLIGEGLKNLLVIFHKTPGNRRKVVHPVRAAHSIQFNSGTYTTEHIEYIYKRIYIYSQPPEILASMGKNGRGKSSGTSTERERGYTQYTLQTWAIRSPPG